jgi:hypothetical protein
VVEKLAPAAVQKLGSKRSERRSTPGLLCVLMVVGAGVCLIAILGMWDKPS